jgi:CheY-like chemotaxis protein
METGPKPRLLVVDDESLLRRIVVTEFERRGWELSEASGAFEAHALLEKQAFEMIISDVRMPEGNGIHLLEAVRMLPGQRPVVILMSGFSEVIEYQAFRLGAAALYTKPFEIKVFADQVEECFSDEIILRTQSIVS